MVMWTMLAIPGALGATALMLAITVQAERWLSVAGPEEPAELSADTTDTPG